MPNDMDDFQKELEADGLSLEGRSKEVPKEEPKEKPKEEIPKEVPKEEPPKEEPKEILNEEDKQERKPREPKQIPAWKVEIDKKRAEKGEAQEKEQLKTELNNLKSEIEQLKGSPTEKKDEFSEGITKLTEKYNVEEEFLKDLFQVLPKSKQELPKDVEERLKRVDSIEEERRIEKENSEYEQSFNSKVIPLLKVDNPSISEDEIVAVKNAMKSDYFSDRYITLDTDEIFKLRNGTYSDLISPKKSTVDKGSRGVSRGEKVIDYDNISEEEYSRLSPEKQEEVENYKIRKQKGL